MRNFILYKIVAISSDMFLQRKTAKLEDGITIEVTFEDKSDKIPRSKLNDKKLVVAKVVLRNNIKQKMADIFIRYPSGLMLLDTGEDYGFAQHITDGLQDIVERTISPLDPSTEAWIQFMRASKNINQIIVAARYGLKDYAENDDQIEWDRLVELPLVSVSVTFECNGEFQVQFSSGTLTIYDESIERINYVAQLLEKYILNGENKIEPYTTP